MGKDVIIRAPYFFSEKALSSQPCQAGMLFLTGTDTHSLQWQLLSRSMPAFLKPNCKHKATFKDGATSQFRLCVSLPSLFLHTNILFMLWLYRITASTMIVFKYMFIIYFTHFASRLPSFCEPISFKIHNSFMCMEVLKIVFVSELIIGLVIDLSTRNDFPCSYG